MPSPQPSPASGRGGCFALGRGTPDEILNEAQFFRDGRREDERIEIGSPDCPIDAVHRDDERRPGVKYLPDASVDVRIEIDQSLMGAFPIDSRLEAEPEGVGHLERVDDMKVK